MTATTTTMIYSRPGCVQCAATYRAFDKAGLAYTVVNVDEDREAMRYVLGLGYSALPVVASGSVTWSGYRPDNILALV